MWQEHSPGRKTYGHLFDLPGYDWACREHYESYEKYLRALSRFQERVVVLEFTLANSGTCVADDIDIELTFPSGLDVRDGYDLPSRPTPPDPKDYSKSFEEVFDGGPAVIVLRATSASVPSKPNGARPTIDCYRNQVLYHVVRAKHHQPVKLGAVYVVFENPESAGSFSISYRLLSSSVPRPIEGVLSVVIRKHNG